MDNLSVQKGRHHPTMRAYTQHGRCELSLKRQEN